MRWIANAQGGLGLAALLVAIASAAQAQAPHHPDAVLGRPAEGALRISLKTPRGDGAVDARPADGSFRVLTEPAEMRGDARRRARLAYGLSEGVEVFVDLQKKRRRADEPIAGRDWLNEQERRGRAYALGVTARW